MKLGKMRVFSARDGKLGVFLQPFTFSHAGQAVRFWEELANDGQSVVSKHPSDFVLYEVGTLCDESGLLEPHSPLIRVMDGMEAKRKPQESLPGFRPQAVDAR